MLAYVWKARLEIGNFSERDHSISVRIVVRTVAFPRPPTVEAPCVYFVYLEIWPLFLLYLIIQGIGAGGKYCLIITFWLLANLEGCNQNQNLHDNFNIRSTFLLMSYLYRLWHRYKPSLYHSRSE